MIKGMTHDEAGVINHVTRYRGKISTGYGPNEPPNINNHPAACGFFRVLREITETQKIGASRKEVTVKKWVLNQPAQAALENQNKKSKTPRIIEFVCLHHSPEDIWESSLAMFSGTEGLLCRSNGFGTPAKHLTFGSENERIWAERQFEGKPGCIFRDCPDFAAGKCKPLGLMKIFPTCDLSTMPYRFETRSINTIIGIESAIKDLWTLLKAAHTIRQIEAGKELPFDGFFGAKLFLVHRKIKSGGREVFVTDLFPTPDFNTMVMEPIKRGLEQKKSRAMLSGIEGTMPLLTQAANNLLAEPVDNDPIPMDVSEQRDIAVNFGANADEDVIPEEGGTLPDSQKIEAATRLLEEGPGKQ